ncbi:MAG: hypothetical protein K0U78_20170 [Actinomycetia bacterium]|nr:hypothetical protein [Actinomycetes bacterium]
MTRAETLWLRGQLVKLLEAAQGPVSSAALAAQLPWPTERLEVGCLLLCRAPRRVADLVVVECHQSWHLVRRPRSSQDASTGIYRHLRSLARTGVIRRICVGARRVEWEYVVESSGRDAP